jgi:hybrid cluster-associated redox disulfide protein
MKESVVSTPNESVIAADATIDSVLTCFPRAVLVFVKRRMHCAGCPMARFETVADACTIYQQPLDTVLRELRAATSAPTPKEFA